MAKYRYFVFIDYLKSTADIQRYGSLSSSNQQIFSLADEYERYFQVLIRPCSKVIVRFLTVMMKAGYIGEFEIIDDHRAGKIVVNLTGRINKCSVISPR